MNNRPHLFFISMLLFAWLAMLIVVNPIGDFPLNDDWTYGASVHYMMNTGHFKIVDGSAAAIFTQVIWGTLFCKLFGFSYTVLRLSTLVLAFIATIFLYFFAFESSNNKGMSFFVALLLAINPLYFSLSNTFMTDVPFLSFSIISCWFFSKAFSKSSYLYVVLGTLLAIAATLIRQAGIVIPLAYSFAVLFTQKNSYAKWTRVIIPSVVTNMALFGFLTWMERSDPLFIPYQDSGGILVYLKDVPSLIFRIYVRTGDVFYYTGFFLLPVLLFAVPRAFMGLPSTRKNAVGIGSFLLLPSIIRAWSTLPKGNILNEDGVGPKLLRDNYILHTNNSGISQLGLHILVTIGMLGAILLAIKLVMVVVDAVYSLKQREFSRSTASTVFLIFFLICYCLLICLPFNFFDRYTLPAFFILALVSVQNNTVSTSKRFEYAFPVLFILVVGLFTVSSTHDYLSWNRARWKAANYLNQNLKISPLFIDGGYEYNGWMLGSTISSIPDKSWWYVIDDEYMLSFGPVAGYKEIKRFSYCSYLPSGTGAILILQRK